MQTSTANRPQTPTGDRGRARSVAYLEHLAAVIAGERGLSKGEATRLGLLFATAQILQEGGYHDLRISQVVQRAGVARGTFYIYFSDKSDIVLSVLSDFRDTLLTAANVDFTGQSWEERVYRSNLAFAEICDANSGLLKAFHQLVDEAEEFRKMRHLKEQGWTRRQLASYVRRFGAPDGPETRETVLRQLHALRAMIERLCTQIYVEGMPELIELYPTPRHVARLCTDIWILTLTRTAAHRTPDVPPART